MGLNLAVESNMFALHFYFWNQLRIGSKGFVITFLLGLVLFLLTHRRTVIHSALIRGLIFLFLISGLCSLVLLSVSSAYYAIAPGYADHIEPTITATSWAWGLGTPMYHSRLSACRYNLPYGPCLYLCVWASQKVVGTSPQVIKCFNLVLTVVGFGLLFHLIKRSSTVFIATLSIGYCALGTLCFHEYATDNLIAWCRSEPYLLFLSCLGLYLCRSDRCWIAAWGTGAALGLALNFKIIAFLYFIPMLALLFKRGRTAAVAECLGVAVLIGAMPIAFLPNVSPVNYFWAVTVSMKRAVIPSTMKLLIAYVLLFWGPICALLALCVKSGAEEWKQYASLVKEGSLLTIPAIIATGAVILPASKWGSGLWHLAPLLPSYSLIVAFYAKRRVVNAWHATPQWSQNVACSMLLAFCIYAMSIAGAKSLARMESTRITIPIALAARAEIENVALRFPGARIAMAYGNESDYKWTYYRDELVFKDNPYLIDFPALLDLKVAGYEIPRATIEELQSGRIGLWLLPKGNEPFSIDHSVFNSEFRYVFGQNYQKEGGTDHFDVYRFRGATRSPSL